MAALENRVTELEVRSAYHEDLLAKLDEVVREFAARTQAVETKLRELEERLVAAESEGAPEAGPHDEKPPHY